MSYIWPISKTASLSSQDKSKIVYAPLGIVRSHCHVVFAIDLEFFWIKMLKSFIVAMFISSCLTFSLNHVNDNAKFVCYDFLPSPVKVSE